MNGEVVIRQEERGDWAAVYEVVKAAFQSAARSDGHEQDLVKALRGSAAFIPALSLVAEARGAVVGHILFTKIQIGPHTELALAPLSVLPAYQRRGVGTALIREGHRIARELGYCYAVVLGSEAYYPRFGYRPAGVFGIQAPFEAPPQNFMAVPLSDRAGKRNGIVAYAKEFGL